MSYESGVVDVDLGGYVEPEIVDGAGLAETYTLRIVNMEARDVDTQNGPATVVDFTLKLLDSGLTNPKSVRYSLWMPRATDDPERKNAAKGRIIRFKKACGMSEEDAKTGGLVKSELVNCELQAKLDVERSEEFGDRNTVKRIFA